MFIIEHLSGQRLVKEQQLAIDSEAQLIGNTYGLKVPEIVVVKYKRQVDSRGALSGSCKRVGDKFEIQVSKEASTDNGKRYAHEITHALLFFNNTSFQLDRSGENAHKIYDEAEKGNTDEAVRSLKQLTVEDFYSEGVATYMGYIRSGGKPSQTRNDSEFVNEALVVWTNKLGDLEDSLERKSAKEKARILSQSAEIFDIAYKSAYYAGTLLGSLMARNRDKIDNERNLFLIDSLDYLNMCFDVCEIAGKDNEKFTNEFFQRLNQLKTIE